MSPPLEEPPPRSRRRILLPFRLSENSDTRAVQIGILGTILLHLILLLLAPRLLQSPYAASKAPAHAIPRTFSIEIAPDAFAPKPPPKAPLPFKYVEANPNAPDNVPDKTNNVSFMNQQVAQEKPTPNGKSEAPALQGRKDFQNNQIVTGELSKPEPPSPPAAPAEKLPPSPAAPRRLQNPLSGDESQKGTDVDGFGSNHSKVLENPQQVPDEVKGIRDAPLVDGATAWMPQVDPRHPQPRKTLQMQHVRPAIFADNQFGTSNIGPIAINAKWSNYGVYMQRLIEEVQVSWDKILAQSQISAPSGTQVTVTFRLNSKGEITAIVSHQSEIQGPAVEACMSAITTPAPYGAWSEDMVSVLGNEQEMTFLFFYQ
jgi:hypothetical protein